MEKIDSPNEEEARLMQSFARIVRYYEAEGFGNTEIARLIGYTSTTQLNNTLENKSMLSTKAILTMIERMNVNPLYLFLGQGEMFLKESEETEFTKLYNEFNKLKANHDEAVKVVMKLATRNTELEKLCAKLMKDTAELVNYYHEKSEKTDESIANLLVNGNND